MKKVTLEDIRAKDIKGYEGIYCMCSCGRVWSYKKNKFLSTNAVGKNKYLQVTLLKDGKRKNFLVHRLNALTYLKNPNNLPVVDHIEHDGTWHPEYLRNLKWSTPENNCCNRANAVPVFDTTTGESWCSMAMAARRTQHNVKTVKKSCEKFRSNKKMKPPRYIYWEDMTLEIFRKHFPILEELKEIDNEAKGA